jgi:hypothetical protein
MMVVVANNEQPREQPITPAEIVPAEDAAPPPATRPPTEITPEEIRKFQEFQRFQELMREQAEKGFPPGNPPPGLLQPWGQPPPKESFGKRLLKATISKIVTGLVVLAVLVIAGYLAVDYFFGENLDDHPKASEVGGGKATTNLIFETTPRNAVLKVYDDVAQGDAESACSRFTDDARDEFARNMAEYGNSCAQIVMTIHNTIAANKMKSEYANPWIPGSAVPPNGDTVAVSSCAMEVTGGPRLGLLTLSKIPNSEDAGGGDAQWIVSGHQAEPADCGGITSPPPTT